MIPPLNVDIYDKTFTPNSKFLYFIAVEKVSGRSVLYRVPALGGVLTEILSDISLAVSFSPDGREMAYTFRDQKAREWMLIIADSDGSNKRILFRRPDNEASLGHAAWSPDGSTIAVVLADKPTSLEGSCTIIGVDVQTAATRDLSPERWDNCYRIVWTKDGQGLVFVGTKYREGYSTRRDQVYYLSVADGEARRLTTDGSRHQGNIGITNNDEVIAVPFNRSSQIWAMDAEGDSGAAVQLTSGLADGRPGIAPLPNGRVGYITRSGDNLNIWIMDADGSNRSQLTNEPPITEELRSTLDGRYFVFSARRDGRSHLYRIDGDGSNLTQLTFGDSLEIDSTISPDGEWVAYSSFVVKDGNSSTRLWKVSIHGGEPLPLSDGEFETPHYSPDGKFVSVVTKDNKIGILSSDDGRLIKVFEPAPKSVLNTGAHWTSDGRALMYIVHRQNVSNIWLQPINGDPPQPLTYFTSGDIYNFAFSSDGARLYLARGYQIRNAVLIANFR
jgi:TolB protein